MVSKYLLRPGDFLVSRSNTLDKVGRSILFQGEIQNTHFSDLMMQFRVNKSKVLPAYLEYCLRSNIARHYFHKSAAGTSGTMMKINKRILERLPIPLPPLPEQRKIAAILTAWDRAIDLTRRLIDARQRRKKALMQRLLTGKVRFPGFTEPWKEVRLGEIFEEIRDKVGETGLTPFSISAGIGFVSQMEKWGRDIAGDQHVNYTRLRPMDFSYNKGNSKRYRFGCVYVSHLDSDIAVPSVFISFRPRQELSTHFYEQYFLGDYHGHDLKRYITSGARSDGLLNLNKTDFFKILVPLPPLKEQRAIGEKLSVAGHEIESLENSRRLLEKQKKGLMQQLLTGKTRVKVER
ncbi:MAG: restriction endonuclease subunit S [Candidatus Marinimicrobia bacterium]|nr:restriction endonuclease subunit S [Candidatus Neomarinimicrobiota bacterium]